MNLTGWMAVGCAALAAHVWVSAEAPGARRLGAAIHRIGARQPETELGARQAARSGGNASQPSPLRQWSVTGLAGVAVAVLVGGPPGLLAGIATALAVAVGVAKLEPRTQRERRTRLMADLPIAVDLLAACLHGGTSWSVAVDAVANAISGPLGDELQAVAVQIRLGADPASAWLTLAEQPELAVLARTAARAVDSGTALAEALTRLAQDQRRAARAQAASRAQAAGVRAVAPLGLCFLPAFIMLGVVPAVAGIARDLTIPM